MNGKRGAAPRGPRRWLLVLAALGLATGLVLGSALIGPSAQEPEEVSLAQAMVHVDAGDVMEASVDEAGRTVTMTLGDDRVIEARYVGQYGETLTDRLLEAAVEVEVEPLPGRSLADILIGLLPFILLLLVLLIIIRYATRMGSEKSKAVEVPDTRFSDVAGVPEAKEEMQELVEFLRDGQRFLSVGARPPKGALLCGPPGTGKTLLARAVAGEAGVPFFEMSGSDFVEKFAGLGPARVRKLFKTAESHGKAIVFIDEIDAIGGKRGSGGGDGATREAEGTLTALLTEIDGFQTTDVIVIGATNRPDVIDPALLRRLERQIQVPLPDRNGRTQILSLHAQGKPFTQDVDWVAAGRQAFGMSGADLEKVVNESALEAARRGSAEIGPGDVYSALSTVEIGRARSSAVITERDREITAWHEAGHALVGMLAPHIEDPSYVTIIPRGGSGGHTRPGGSDHSFVSRPEALDHLAMLMGGRAAEIMLLGEGHYTQGASGDLQQATDLTTKMITQYGMGRYLSQVDPDALKMGGSVSMEVRDEADVLIRASLDRAHALLLRHEGTLKRMASALLERETLDKDEMRGILQESGRANGEVSLSDVSSVVESGVPAPAPAVRRDA